MIEIDVDKYTEFLTEVRTEELSLKRRLNKLGDEKKEVAAKKVILEEAKRIINEVLIAVLEDVRVFIEESSSLCLSAVFGDDYRVRLDYDIKRDRSQANFYLVHNDCEFDPRCETGGGIVDVMSFGNRLALWVLSEPRTEPVFVLDEPFRFVSNDLMERIAEMLHQTKEIFDAQFVIVSHNNSLIDAADKTIRVLYDDFEGVSSIVQIN